MCKKRKKWMKEIMNYIEEEALKKMKRKFKKKRDRNIEKKMNLIITIMILSKMNMIMMERLKMNLINMKRRELEKKMKGIISNIIMDIKAMHPK